MNTNLTEINLLWLEITAKNFGVDPKVLLNVILDQLRHKDQSGKLNLPDWIDAAGRDEDRLAVILEKIGKTTSEVYYAVKATQHYVNLIQANRT